MHKVFFKSLLILWIFALCSSPCVAALPIFDHIVIVIEENHSYSQIVGSSAAPYINMLLKQNGCATFASCSSITHPSQPNYLALFSGSTQLVTDDNYHPKFKVPCLGSQLIDAHKTFGGYSEYLPYVGYDGISYGYYARKHNPWTQFTTLSESTNLPFTAFPTNFDTLPTISFVIPGQNDDAHSGSIQTMDTWIKTHLGAYINWAPTHNSLFILTFDENSSAGPNILCFFYGAHVKKGTYYEKINHYNVLRTLEDIYSLPHLGNTASVSTITDVWN